MANKVIIPRFIPKDDQSLFDMPPGHWGSRNGIAVFARCNETNHLVMRINHKIDSNGVLSPSLGCNGQHDLGLEHFHIWATFENWTFKMKDRV